MRKALAWVLAAILFLASTPAQLLAHGYEPEVGGTIRRIFEEEGIRDELDSYNPLVPDGSNWKATMLIEYPDIDERRVALAQLIGIEDRVWVAVEGQPRVYAIADEDLDRENDDKTSAVHFLRFELSAPMKQALKQGVGLSMGIDHPNYSATINKAGADTVASLLQDLMF